MSSLLHKYAKFSILSIMDAKLPKPIIWIGSSLRDLRKLPSAVRREIGHALHMEEVGERSHKAKMLKGFSGVIEIVSDYVTNTYRAVYAIKIDNNIYVLHVFKKKSKRGIATTKRDLDKIKRRLQIAKHIAKENRI